MNLTALVWLYVPFEFPGLTLMTVQRHWELFKVFKGFPRNFGLGRGTFFLLPLVYELYLTWTITSAGISKVKMIRVKAGRFKKCQWTFVNLHNPTIRPQ